MIAIEAIITIIAFDTYKKLRENMVKGIAVPFSSSLPIFQADFSAFRKGTFWVRATVQE